MDRSTGIEVEDVRPGSPADAAGIAAGDIILAINGHKVNDTIDFMFFTHGDEVNVLIQRKTGRLSVTLPAKEGHDYGMALKPFKVRTCTNKCIFCFVGQLPRGLRRPLYIRDEDYRMSFLYGNYITLTNLSAQDKGRIVQQRLSPLYISVHSTDRGLRNLLLGNPRASDVLKELTFFRENRIRTHCQIVLCPGYNDGEELRKTVKDLYRFYPYVLSVAVVPVGLTEHRKAGPPLRPLERQDALQAIETIDAFQRRFRRKHGDSIVYGSDELYIKAGVGFPALTEYGELPQIENGVGMVPLFMHQARRIKIPQLKSKRRVVTFTGASFFPYLNTFLERLRRNGADIEAAAVGNTFFGKSVTVAGLLTGRDVAKALSDRIRKEDLLLVPDVVMKEGEEVFLDDVSLQALESILGVQSMLIQSTPKGLIDALSSIP